MELIYAALQKTEDYDFYVGYFHRPDTFEIIKGFKRWEEAQDYYFKLYFETLRPDLRILDMIHKKYYWLDFRQEDAE